MNFKKKYKFQKISYSGIISFVYVGKEEILKYVQYEVYDCLYGQDSKSKKNTKMAEKLQNSQNWPFQINSNHFGKKILEKLQNGQNWPFLINSNHFGKKILEKLQIGQNWPF